MQSKAKTVPQYLKALPADRRAVVEAVRKVVLANMDPALEEGIQYGMIAWYVPFSLNPGGYHVNPELPLTYAFLGSQKNHLSLHLMSVYGDDTQGSAWFRAAWAKTGKKLDMGKACVRFKKVEDLALDVIAESFRRVRVKDYLALYAKWDPRKRATKATKATKQTAARKPTARAR